MVDKTVGTLFQNDEDNFIFDDTVTQDDGMLRDVLVQGRDPEDPTRFVRVRVFRDPDPLPDDMCSMTEDSPSLGVLLYGHRRYDFPGEKLKERSPRDYFGERGIDPDKDLVSLPVYMYEHSGMTVRTTPFHDRWDSGQLGIIYTTEERARAFFAPDDNDKTKATHFLEEKKSQIEEVLEAQVKLFDHYLRGDGYGFICEEGPSPEGPWEELDSCWGFLGSVDDSDIGEQICDADPSIAALWKKAFPPAVKPSPSEERGGPQKENIRRPAAPPSPSRAPGI